MLMAAWLLTVEVVPSRVLPPSMVWMTPPPASLSVPPMTVALCSLTLPPLAKICPPVESSTVEFWIVSPLEPVDVIRPALVMVLPVLSSRALADELALIAPPAWLTRVSWPKPR